jgi:hypothetical protein
MLRRNINATKKAACYQESLTHLPSLANVTEEIQTYQNGRDRVKRSEITPTCSNKFRWAKLRSLRESALAATCAVAVACLGSAGVRAWVAPVPEAFLTTVEGALVPDSFGFQIDQPVANCPANTWLFYDGGSGFPRASAVESMRQANVRAIFQMLMAQKIAGAKIRVYASAGATNINCRIEFIHAI